MFPVDAGTVFLVEQNCSGTGVFNGTNFGKATLTLGAGISQVKFTSFLYGTNSNNIKIQLLDEGAGVTRTSTAVEFTGSDFIIHLRRNPSMILATADEVAAVVNEFFNKQNGPVVAIGGGSGIVVPTSPTFMSGGISPAINFGGSIFTFTRSNLNGGFFHLENKPGTPLIVRDFEAKFQASGSATVTFSRVNLNSNLEEIAGTSIPFYVWDDLDVSKPDISVNDIRVLIQPFQAVKVECSASFTGLVRLNVRRESNFPYL